MTISKRQAVRNGILLHLSNFVKSCILIISLIASTGATGAIAASESGSAPKEQQSELKVPALDASDPVSELQLSPQERSWLEQHSIIRVVLEKDLPPLQFINDDDQLDGIAVDYLQLIEERLDISFSFEVSDDTNDSLRRLLNEEADIAPVMVAGEAKGGQQFSLQ